MDKITRAAILDLFNDPRLNWRPWTNAPGFVAQVYVYQKARIAPAGIDITQGDRTIRVYHSRLVGCFVKGTVVVQFNLDGLAHGPQGLAAFRVVGDREVEKRFVTFEEHAGKGVEAFEFLEWLFDADRREHATYQFLDNGLAVQFHDPNIEFEFRTRWM